MINSKDRQILRLLRDSYFGTGGFEFCTDDSSSHEVNVSGDGSYLVRHHREVEEDYRERQKIAYYLNYVQPVVDSHVAPIFRRDIQREVSCSAQSLWDAFAADADGAGNSIGDVMRNAAYPAKRDGIHVLCLALPKESPKTVAESMQMRPVVFGVEASEIEDIERDKFGNIAAFRYFDCLEYGGETKEVIFELTGTGWTVFERGIEGKRTVYEEGEWERPWPMAPVVEIAPGLRIHGHDLPRSEFVAVARANHRLFNLQSELDEVLRNQAFSILIYPSTDLKELTVGANNLMGYDPSQPHEPKYIAPSADPSSMIMEQFDRVVREIYRMSLLSHQTGTVSKTQQQQLPSGIALRIDREALDAALSDYARSLQAAEKRLVQLWSWATGVEVQEAAIVYPHEFTLQDMQTELAPLLDAWSALATDAPVALKVGVLERMSKLLVEGDEERSSQISHELDAMLQNGENDHPVNDASDNDGI